MNIFDYIFHMLTKYLASNVTTNIDDITTPTPSPDSDIDLKGIKITF